MDTKFVVEVNHDDLEFEIERNNEFEYEFSNLHIIDVSEDLKQELVVVPTTEQQVIVPEGDQVYDKVTVEPIQPPFVDVSDTTATPDDVSKDKVFYDASGTKQTGTLGGEMYLCRVIDWEGTVLKEEWLPVGATFTMPADPTYEGLVFDGWSGPVDLVDNAVVVEDIDLIFGAMYHTASGLTEVDIELNEATGLSVTLNMVGNKNWGDGTTDTETTHTYTDYGNYTITCDSTELQSTYIFGQSSDIANYYVKSVRFGNITNFLKSNVLHNCRSIETLLLPSSINSRISNFFLKYLVNLKALVFPQGCTGIFSDNLHRCYNLENVVFPKTFFMRDNCMSYNNKIEYLSLPKNLILTQAESTGGYIFASMRKLKRIKVFADIMNTTYLLNNSYNVESVYLKYRADNGSQIARSFCLNCYNLKDLYIDNEISLTKAVCTNCHNLENIYIKNLGPLYNNAFSNCQKLKSITLKGTLSDSKINEGVCRYCYNLESVTFIDDGGIQSIGRNALSDCGLKGTLELPNSVVTINGMNNLLFIDKLIMPASLTTLGSYFGQENLAMQVYDFTKVSVVPTLAYSSSYTFANINQLCKIVVPDELYDAWLVATNWVNFSQYIVKASEYKGE